MRRQIAGHLPTEQPQISNRQADMLVRTDQGSLRHVEFQASNDPEFPFRMLDYWVYFRREHRQRVKQCVLYVGSEPMRLPDFFEEDGTKHTYDLVNLQEYEAADLLASPDWGDNLWALGAKGERPVVLRAVLEKLMALPGEERKAALAELTAFSGILKIDDLLNRQLKEFPMLDLDINLEENAVVRPLIEKGRQQGRQEGRQEGRTGVLRDLLAEKFGLLPVWAEDRLDKASPDQVNRWARRVLRGDSLEETLD